MSVSEVWGEGLLYDVSTLRRRHTARSGAEFARQLLASTRYPLHRGFTQRWSKHKRHGQIRARVRTNLKKDAYHIASAFTTVFTHAADTHGTGPAQLTPLYSNRDTQGYITHAGIDRTPPFSQLRDTHKSMSVDEAAQMYTEFAEGVVETLSAHYPDKPLEMWRASLAIALPYALYHDAMENPEIPAAAWSREWLQACDKASGHNYSGLVKLETKVELTAPEQQGRTLILPERARLRPAETTCCMAFAIQDPQATRRPQSLQSCINCSLNQPSSADTIDGRLRSNGLRLHSRETYHRAESSPPLSR